MTDVDLEAFELVLLRRPVTLPCVAAQLRNRLGTSAAARTAQAQR
jgi:hypothetical protein